MWIENIVNRQKNVTNGIIDKQNWTEGVRLVLECFNYTPTEWDFNI